MPTRNAQRMAEEQGLDLVEVAATAMPPVCKIMDFGKFKYDLEKKSKESKKKQVIVKIKEVKFHSNVEDHDYQTKIRHSRDFIEEGHKVKCTLFFRGRENTHVELGFELFQRVMEDLKDIGHPEQLPRLQGKMLGMMIGPGKAKGPIPKVIPPPRQPYIHPNARPQQGPHRGPPGPAAPPAPGAPGAAPGTPPPPSAPPPPSGPPSFRR